MKVIASVCEAAAGKVGQVQQEASSMESVLSPEPLKKRASLDHGFSPPNHSLLPSDDSTMRDTDLDTAMESFEASAAVQEAEDRLEQLLLEDELSDARMGTLLDPGMGSGLSPGIGTGLVSESSSKGVPGESQHKEMGEPPSSRSKLEQLGRRGSRTTSTQAERLELTTTMDSKEKERLEDSMAIAGYVDTTHNQLTAVKTLYSLNKNCYGLILAAELISWSLYEADL